MPEQLCVECHIEPVSSAFAPDPVCSIECYKAWQHCLAHAQGTTVEQDIVDPREIASVVKRAISEGWTIIAITPYKFTKHDPLLGDQRVLDYLIIRSR